jgi:hypothetical protein
MKTVAFAAAAAALASASPSFATVLYSTGFESPGFSTGAIAGQNGWLLFGGSTSVIENSFAFAGSQALEVSGVTSPQSGPWRSFGAFSPTVPITVSAEIYVTEGNWQFAVLGPGLSQFAGGFDFTAGAGVQSISTGYPTIGTVTADAWHDFSMTLDYATQTYSLSLDGVSLGTGIAFCGDNNPCGGANIAHFGTVIFDSFGTTGQGYLDNFSVSTPEPATWAMMLAGFAGLGAALRSRRRLSAAAL